MQYKIIASDLDKTLLNKDQKVSAENWRAIEKMHEMGIHFVPASGRAFEEMPTELLESPLIRYFITSDGTTVHDKETGITHELPLPTELARQVLDKIYAYPICLMLHADTKSYVEEATHNPRDYARFHMNDYWIDFSLEKEAPVRDLKSFAYKLPAIQSIVPFFLNIEDKQACKAYFEQDPRLLLAQTDPYNLEIFSADAGKGNALMLLADILGIDPKATIAVGDSTNDRTMVQAAGLGLAVDNAVPELKAVADEVICDHTEHCAKYILEHYIEK